MRAHFGAVLTSGLAAVALALALLQAAVLLHGATRRPEVPPPRAQSNRYSAPGGRSGIPYTPFENHKAPTPEGRTPEKQQQEERRSPPPVRQRSVPPPAGPRPPRRAVA